MDRGVFTALCSPLDDAASLDAARQVLSSPAAATALYPQLLSHKTLRVAMRHLERAGGDLGAISIPSEAYASVYPLPGMIPMPAEGPAGHVSLLAIRDRLDEHREHLRGLVAAAIAAAGSDEVMVIQGRAFEAAYPSLSDRLDFDVDLVTPDLTAAVRLATVLREHLGMIVYRCRVSRELDGWRGLFNTFRIDDGFELHADVLGGGQPVGIGVMPSWFRPPLFERSRTVGWRGIELRVPSAEEMLLMTAARLQRKRSFTRRDHNDARFLLLEEETNLDWDHVLAVAASNGLGRPLHRLLGDAQAREGRPLAPPEAAARLERDAGASTGRSPRTLIGRKLRAVRRTVQTRPAGTGSIGALTSAARTKWSIRVDALGLRVARSGRRATGWVQRGLRALRPGFGSLCELRETRPAGGRFCLSRTPGAPARRPGGLEPDEERTLGAAVRLLPDDLDRAVATIRSDGLSKGHRCQAFLYRTWSP